MALSDIEVGYDLHKFMALCVVADAALVVWEGCAAYDGYYEVRANDMLELLDRLRALQALGFPILDVTDVQLSLSGDGTVR